MKIIKPADILKPKYLAPLFFAGLGGYKTYKDYKEAKPKNKKYTLTKDTVILTTSAAGYALATAIAKKTPKTKIVDTLAGFLGKPLNKLAQKKWVQEKIAPYFPNSKHFDKASSLLHHSLNNVEQAIKDCINATLVTSASIAAAFGGNEIVSRYIFKKHSQQSKIKPNEKNKTETPKPPLSDEADTTNKPHKVNYIDYVNQEFSKDPANKVFASMSFLPVLRALEFPMTAVQGFDINREKDMTDKIKRTSYSLIANTFVPTFFISIATAITRGAKNCVRFPAIAVSTLAGIAAGTIAGKYAENKFINDLNLK